MYNPDVECSRLMNNLKELCKIKSMSVNMVAKKAGLSASALNELMNGKTKPQVYTLLKVCNALEVTLSELFWGVGGSNVSGTEDGTDYGSMVAVNSSEREFLFRYRNLPGYKKEMLEVYMEMLITYEGASESEVAVGSEDA